MSLIDFGEGGDCWVGDPSDSNHSGRGLNWCTKCKNKMCDAHTMFREVPGSHFGYCAVCWERGRPNREGTI
jgi:hypothetical protein